MMNFRLGGSQNKGFYDESLLDRLGLKKTAEGESKLVYMPYILSESVPTISDSTKSRQHAKDDD